ncbi:MAG: PD-(D/E)XK nuclease family transposase, partial [Phascolarctobacterium sp.]
PNSLLVSIEELIEQIQAMNLFNDTFISVVFKDDASCLHLVRQLMQKPDLKIIACRTQDAIPMLISKSPRLDITAEDDQGTLYEIEIQRLDEPAPARRVRYYSSVMDSELLRKGVTYDKLPEVYLFYLSENDIWQRGKTVYEIEQLMRIDDDYIPYDNGMHTIYVNAEIDDGSNIAKLMQYLKTAKAGDTSQGALSEHVNYLKSPEGGREVMGEFERICKEKGREEVHRETALKMLKDKKPLEEIIRYSDLAKEAIFALAKENGLEVIVG